ncbi:MAG TPA: sulfite exporter TauE/SafE family protein [candidate division Zixibacteria bacterium]|nr:sulfite exporter TauE/SafE family protein [candidate division Zixibacteria bacterium]
MELTLVLALLFLAAAVLYGMVGHAGASAYLAAMALVGLDPAVMRPTALTLNILVAVIVTARFARAGYVRPRSALPFLVASVPAAFVGGMVHLPGDVYRPLVGGVLLFAAARFGVTAGRPAEERPPNAPLPAAMVSGGLIGLLAGLTGTGGGIFLTPLLIAAGWAGTRFAAGTSIVFILGNSIAGLAGNVAAVGGLPPQIVLWMAVVAAGGAIGSELGSRRLPAPWVRRALAVVLVVAGLKLIFLP